MNIPHFSEEQIASFGAALLVVWGFLKKWIGGITSIAEPLIKEAEQMALDGKIDKADRKKLVMDGITMLEAQGKIKLNFIEKMIISMIVDKIAAKLPDYVVSKEAAGVLTQLTKGVEK